MQTSEEVVMDVPPNLVLETDPKVMADVVSTVMNEQRAAENALLEIPEELKKKTAALKALAANFNLLDKGLFLHHQGALVLEVLNFVKSLHEQVLKEALEHPLANLVPEFKEIFQRDENVAKN